VVLVHTQKIRHSIRKAHLGTTSDTRLFSAVEKRTSHFKRVKSVRTQSGHPRPNSLDGLAHPAKIASTWRAVMITKRCKAFDDEEAQPKSTRRARISSLV
jgi:hypothetical protein